MSELGTVLLKRNVLYTEHSSALVAFFTSSSKLSYNYQPHTHIFLTHSKMQLLKSLVTLALISVLTRAIPIASDFPVELSERELDELISRAPPGGSSTNVCSLRCEFT